MSATMRRTSLGTCDRCHSRIHWLRDPSSRYVALDVHAVPGGGWEPDWSLGTVTPRTTPDPSVSDEMARPVYHVLHRDTCRNVTYRRLPRQRSAQCGRHLWRPPDLVVCTLPTGHKEPCP